MALIDLERPADGVALLTLNRPDIRNALGTELREEGCRLLADLAADGGVRALVVTGAGTVFSAGFDLREFEQAAGDEAFGRRGGPDRPGHRARARGAGPRPRRRHRDDDRGRAS